MIPLPDGFGISLEESVKSYRDGEVLLGGMPIRAFRLSAAGRDALRELRSGDAGASSAARLLGRRLVEAGIARAWPPPSLATATGTGPGPGALTVVVPVRDAAAQLDRCLDALGTADPVLVVDDGSVDPAAVADVCRARGARLLRNERPRGPAGARNVALASVTTDGVAFIDCDCVPATGWVRTLAGHLADPCVAAVAPRIRAASGARSRSVCVRFAAARSPLDMGPHGGEVGPGRRIAYVPSAALVVRRAALGSGFDEALRYGEDVDLVWRLNDEGWRVRYVPEVVVGHAEPARWRGLLRRRFRYGTSAAPLARRHPGRLPPVILRPWPTMTAALFLMRRPTLGAGMALLTGIRVGRRLRAAGAPPWAGFAGAARAASATALGLGRASTMLAPFALLAALRFRRTRPRALALLAAPALAEWWTRRPALDPVRWTAAAVADDLAYGAGVWTGCMRERTAAPLVPLLR